MVLRFDKKNTQSAIELIIIAIAMGEGYVVRVLFNKFSEIFLGNIISGEAAMFVTFGLLCFCILSKTLNSLIRQGAVDAIIVFAILVIASITTAVFHNDNMGVIDLPRLFLFYFPTYCVVRSIEDFDYVKNHAWIIGLVFFAFLLFVYNPENVNNQQGYDTHMVTGYQFGLCALIFFEKAKISKQNKATHILFLIMAIFSLIFVVLKGSRGTLIIMVVYFVVRFLQNKNVSVKTKIYRLVIILISVSCIIFYKQIIVLLSSAIGDIASESRTLSWLLSMDDALDSSGRDIIYEKAFSYIKQAFPFGYGLGGDRILLNKYAHNLFLELIIDFGTICGGIISVYILVFFFKSLRNTFTRDVAVIFCIYAIVKLMFSGSYLDDCEFWVALAIIFSFNKYKSEELSLQ